MYITHERHYKDPAYQIHSSLIQQPVMTIVDAVLSDLSATFTFDSSLMYEVIYTDPSGTQRRMEEGKRDFQNHLYQVLASLSPGQMVQYRQDDPNVCSITMDDAGHYRYSYLSDDSQYMSIAWNDEPAPYCHHIVEDGTVTARPVSDFTSYCVQYLQSLMTPTSTVDYFEWDEPYQDRLVRSQMEILFPEDHLGDRLSGLKDRAVVTYAIRENGDLPYTYQLTIGREDGNYMMVCYGQSSEICSTIAPTPT